MSGRGGFIFEGSASDHLYARIVAVLPAMREFLFVSTRPPRVCRRALYSVRGVRFFLAVLAVTFSVKAAASRPFSAV